MENPSMPMTLLASIAQLTIDLIAGFKFLNYLLSLMNCSADKNPFCDRLRRGGKGKRRLHIINDNNQSFCMKSIDGIVRIASKANRTTFFQYHQRIRSSDNCRS